MTVENGLRALFGALSAGGVALACSSSSTSSSSSTADAGPLRYYELVVGGSPCITEPAPTLDSQGLTTWRYVIAYPSGGPATCVTGLKTVDSSTAAALTSAAHLTSSALCELPQVASSSARDGASCVPDAQPEWCYEANVMVGSTHCDQAALASAGSPAGAPQMSRYFILF